MKLINASNMSLKYLAIVITVISFLTCNKNTGNGNSNPPPVTADSTFTNPLLSSGPDPWVIQMDTNYYFTRTFGNKLAIYKTNKMSALNNAAVTTIWTPPPTGAYSSDIWAPELHYLQGKWYMYFAADSNNINSTHRIYVLENPSVDPTIGSWTFKGKVSDSSDKWAIDASEFDYNGQSYLIWSGWQGDVDGEQDIFISRLANPWTISGARVMISSPLYSWEKNGAPPIVNEGPEVIQHNNRVYLTYSASGCWTDDYALGMLSLKQGGDPMNAADWVKSTTPIFTKKPENGAFGPGHNGFFVSRDGNENWLIYHANSSAGQGCGDLRNPRIQPFTWNTDGSPNFGQPVNIHLPLRKPSGE
ncbi:MAG: family 43 glycosylhydrolase [Flavisolibacter sp.]